MMVGSQLRGITARFLQLHATSNSSLLVAGSFTTVLAQVSYEYVVDFLNNLR